MNVLKCLNFSTLVYNNKITSLRLIVRYLITVKSDLRSSHKIKLACLCEVVINDINCMQRKPFKLGDRSEAVVGLIVRK